MNMLEQIKLSENKTIKSMELVKIINNFRELESSSSGKEYKELLHKSFMTKIKNELEVLKNIGCTTGQNILLSEYKDSTGRKLPCYELNKNGMLQMLNSESALVRYKTIEYINYLESKINKPSYSIEDPIERAKAWIKEQEEKKVLEEQNKLLLPKAEFYDTVIENNTTFDMAKTAKILNIKGLGRNNLMTLLRGKKILKKDNTPYQEYVERGYFKVVECTNIKNDKINYKTVCFNKGIEYIKKLLKDK